MAALPQCDAFGYIYDTTGAPAPDVLVTLKRVEDADGNAISISPLSTFTDSTGAYRFTLPQNAIAFLTARATLLWTCDPSGQPLKVPASPAGEFEPAFPFSPPISAVSVLPPLRLIGNTLSIPKASATQDGYLSAADYLSFLAGAEMGVLTFNARTGDVVLVSTDVSTALGYTPLGATLVPSVAGTYPSPASITVNAQGLVIAVTPGGPDITPPDITVAPVSAIGANTATINWSTNEPADSLVDYGINTSYGGTATDAEFVTDHHINITGLLEKTPYHYRITSTDPAGNPQVSADFTFTTADVTAPVITLQAPTGIVPTGAVINWSTDEPADSLVNYGTALPYDKTTGISHPVPPGVTSHSVPLTLLLPGTQYHYSVTSKDAAGNSRSSLDATVTTAAAPDTTPPDITNIVVTPSSNGAVITWDTNELADTQADYGPSAGPPYASSTVLDTAMKTLGHTVTISGLDPSTAYHYSVKSRNVALLLNSSADATFMTTAAPAGDLMAGLMSYWKLDETSGNRMDSHGPNHMIPVPGVNFNINSEPGRIGNCVHSPGDTSGGDGIAPYLQCPYDPSQDMPGDFTLAGWLRVDMLGYQRQLPCIVSCWDTAGGNRSFILLYNGLGLHFQFSISTDGVNQADLNIPATYPPEAFGQWDFLCARYTAATGLMSLRQNNDPPVTGFATETTTSALLTGPAYPATAAIKLMAFDTYMRIGGAVDEVSIYKRLLSDAEVDVLASGTVTYPFGPLPPPLMLGLVSYWKLDETTGTRFDAHGANHFTTISDPQGTLTVVPGRLGNAPHFPPVLTADAGTEFAAADNPSQALPGDFTITGWMKQDPMGPGEELPTLLSKWSTTDHGFVILYNGFGEVAFWQFSVSSDGTDQHDCTIADPDFMVPFDGLLHFICCQYNAAIGVASLSIDNGTPATLDVPPITAGPIHQSHAELKVGGFDTFRRTNGLIDEIALYNRLLTPAEITMLFAAPTYPFS